MYNLPLICNAAGGRKDVSVLLEHRTTERSLEVLDQKVMPKQFNLQKQLSILHEHHRQRRSACQDRYLLFMLDTSGSIGSTVFKDMVQTLSDLVPLFCDNTKVAAMTFGSHVYHEFCFNCYDKAKINEAIKSIPYHGGGTHTGRAVKCACEEILTIPCGLPTRNEYQRCPAPIDVIIITDGRSNGPLDVCKQAKCLHQQSFYDVNTFTIGVGNYEEKELDCIIDKNDLNVNHIFNMEDFDELEEFLKMVLEYLQQPIDPNKPQDPSNYRLCYDINKGFEK